MYRFLLYNCLVLILCSFFSCQGLNPELGEKTSFRIASDHTGTTYNIQVVLPPHYDSSEHYETIYILDGNWYFNHASEEVARISNQTNKQHTIVVGINHGNRRMTDYTPTKTSEGEGGAGKFTSFLTEELIPHIEGNFPSDTTRKSRLILGHSAGGLYAAFTFTNHSHLFGNYVMLSPAIWYDDGICLQYEKENKTSNEHFAHTVFISKAELEPTQLFTEIFYKRLNTYENIDLGYHTVKGKNHASSAKSAITEALKFYFNAKPY